MTKTEIMNKIEELKNRQFFLAMKDHWSFEDYNIDKRLSNEIKELEKVLKRG